jgi:N-acetyl-gamma-glutamylphosphate reductase
MVIYEEVYVNNFYKELWLGGLDTYKELEKRGISDEEIEQMLEEFFCDDEFIDITKINDFLWFESATVFDYFGISEDEDEDEEKE